MNDARLRKAVANSSAFEAAQRDLESAQLRLRDAAAQLGVTLPSADPGASVFLAAVQELAATMAGRSAVAAQVLAEARAAELAFGSPLPILSELAGLSAAEREAFLAQAPSPTAETWAEVLRLQEESRSAAKREKSAA